jgi:hypothetical protein
VSTKSDVYSFGVLLVELVNEKETFDVQGQNVGLHEYTKWAKNIDVQGQFEDMLHAIINNSIVGLNKIEAQKLMQISIKCIQVKNSNFIKYFCA